MNLEEKIKNGWEVSAEGYSKRIVRTDFVSPGREIWTDLILSQAPRAGKLRILDVGTGPGVFATLLTLAGHSVTGIDVSPKMLEEARMNSAARGAFPDFLLMNSQNLTFDPESFDMIVSRYVVWALEYPENVYESWLRILKPGGRVVVFDGGHPQREPGSFREEPDMEKRRIYLERFGENMPISYSNYEEARGWKRELPLTYAARPDWDIETLRKLGYVNVLCDDIGEKAWYTEQQKFINEGELFFRLCADKAK